MVRVTRNTRPASQALDPSADKPREVVAYTGLNSSIQVFDAMHRIRVVLSGEIPRGVKGGLRIEGFKPIDHAKTIWEAPNTVSAIYGAQAVADIFFKGELS